MQTFLEILWNKFYKSKPEPIQDLGENVAEELKKEKWVLGNHVLGETKQQTAVLLIPSLKHNRAGSQLVYKDFSS